MSESVDKPEVGRKVAGFTVETTAGPLKLSDLKGRKVVLYFYPKDNTPGCTTEGADFAASHARFRKAGAEVFGVSRCPRISGTPTARTWSPGSKAASRTTA